MHRPGAFKTKLTATRDVNIIVCPTEEDTEDTENIIVERQWEQQLQYLIAVSGRSFYIGGTMPVMFTLMPLTKMKIFRLSIFIEGEFSSFILLWRLLIMSRACRLLHEHAPHSALGLAHARVPALGEGREGRRTDPPARLRCARRTAQLAPVPRL